MSPALIRPVMSGVLLRDLVAARGLEGVIRPVDHRGVPEVAVTGVSLDSRAVLVGDLYAALPGFNTHGAVFAAAAVAAGAVAILTDPDGLVLLSESQDHGPVPVLLADDPRAVLGAVAARIYGEPADRLTMIGITGTNGKTTTAYLVESALRASGRRTGLVGTVETRIGDERVDSVRTTPESTDLHAMLGVMVERGIDACVMEVSSHALHQHRVDGVVYDVALFTNLSQDHLDYHLTMQDYFDVKAALFTPSRSRAGVVCVDDEWGRSLAQRTAELGLPVITLATVGGVSADWFVHVPPQPGADSAFVLREATGERKIPLVSHLPGTFNIANTALAALALLATGLGIDEITDAMSVPAEVPGRMEIVSAGGPAAIDGPRCIVDFAHTPDAVDAALAALRPSTSGRLVAVLGAGGDRDTGKRSAMGAAAARHADVVVVTDDNPRSEEPAAIRAQVMAGARAALADGTARATEVIDGGGRAQAIAEAIALTMLEPGNRVDTVVVLGKGHEKGQEVAGVKHPFDDRDAVRSALQAAPSVGGPS